MAGRVVTLVPRLLHPAASALTPATWGVTRLPHAHTNTHGRTIHTSHATCLKEIIVEEEGDTTKIEGHYLPSPRSNLLVKPKEAADGACPLCALNLDVKHTDVLILSQFMTSDGKVMPRRVTGLCGKQQRRISWLVIMAQKAGLMPNLAPANSKRDPRRRYGSKKLNRYFDEKTLPFY